MEGFRFSNLQTFERSLHSSAPGGSRSPGRWGRAWPGAGWWCLQDLSSAFECWCPIARNLTMMTTVAGTEPNPERIHRKPGKVTNPLLRRSCGKSNDHIIEWGKNVSTISVMNAFFATVPILKLMIWHVLIQWVLEGKSEVVKKLY